MTDPARDGSFVSKDNSGNTLYKKDFWSKENLKYSRSHYRLEKSARIINKIARGRRCKLLDVGCGGAALRSLLRPNIEYYGIDIAIHDQAPNLIEADFLEAPIPFADKRFDIVTHINANVPFIGRALALEYFFPLFSAAHGVSPLSAGGACRYSCITGAR
jgi:hypothetical protein